MWRKSGGKNRRAQRAREGGRCAAGTGPVQIHDGPVEHEPEKPERNDPADTEDDRIDDAHDHPESAFQHKHKIVGTQEKRKQSSGMQTTLCKEHDRLEESDHNERNDYFCTFKSVLLKSGY